MSPSRNFKEPFKAEAYTRRRSSLGRLLFGLFALIWAVVFCVLAVLRLDTAHPISFIWALLLLILALGSAYAGLFGISTWWQGRKNRS